MSSDIRYPKLRHPIDIRLGKIDNQELILINCPLGISPAPLALITAVGPVIACLDGNMSVEDILNKFSMHGLTPEILSTIINLLDENLFLATPKFFQAQSTAHDSSKLAKLRPAALAGRIYSNQKLELEKEIDGYILNHPPQVSLSTKSITTLVAPHIDYRRGHITYGKTYGLLKDYRTDLYILIGTSHQFSKNIFLLTLKDFDSPLGILPCDTVFMQQLASMYGVDRSFEEEILHKKEHSLELQVPFLKRLHPDSKIAPILVGSFFHMLDSGKLPENFEEYDKFAYSLTECIKTILSAEKTFSLIAGVDMAHVGRHFGDKESLTPEIMNTVQDRDMQYIDHINKQNKKALFEHIAEDMDLRRICGFPTMYTIIDIFDRLGIKYKSNLIEYRQAVDYSSDCAVTFAGMCLTA